MIPLIWLKWWRKGEGRFKECSQSDPNSIISMSTFSSKSHIGNQDDNVFRGVAVAIPLKAALWCKKFHFPVIKTWWTSSKPWRQWYWHEACRVYSDSNDWEKICPNARCVECGDIKSQHVISFPIFLGEVGGKIIWTTRCVPQVRNWEPLAYIDHVNSWLQCS